MEGQKKKKKKKKILKVADPLKKSKYPSLILKFINIEGLHKAHNVSQFTLQL